MQAHSYETASLSEEENDMPEITGNRQKSRSPITKPNSLATRTLVALPQRSQERAQQARRLKLALVSGRVVLDGALLLVAFVMAYWLRYGLEFGRDVISLAACCCVVVA